MHVAAPGVKDPPSVSSVCGNATLAGNQQKALCCPWKGRATQASDGRRSWSSVTPPKPCLAEDAPTAAHCPTLFGLTADDQVDSSSHPAMPNQPLLLTGGPQSRALPRYRGYTHFRCPALGQPFFAADHTPRVHRLTISSGPRSCNTADIALVTGSHRW
mgnify:CR=1 FL=1